MSHPHRWLLPLALALPLACGGCSDHALLAASRQAFDAYQDALFAGDRNGLRRTLSADSREIIGRIPLQRAQGKERLEVIDAQADPPRVIITALDPNSDGAERKYVLVKEGGKLVLDLLESTTYNHVVTAAGEDGPKFTPDQLSPHEIERIRSRFPDAFR